MGAQREFAMRRLYRVISIVLMAGVPTVTRADETLYRYEGNVAPYDPTAGWLIYNPCEPPCTESVEAGHFLFRWPRAYDYAAYAYRIAVPGEAPPPSLWVEWRFRSNHPLGASFYSCDAQFDIQYGGMSDLVFMYGDAVISFSGDDFVAGLDINEFHTYRYESLDGINYTFAVDGRVFVVNADNSPNGLHRLQLRGSGGCNFDQIPDMVNEWDFVRYGTIDFGERITVTDPPSGLLDPVDHANLDRIAVAFDSANYVYRDEITVQVSDGVAPRVLQTRRRENDESDTVEIVLDRPLSTTALTRFIFNDGVAVNVVEYFYQPAPQGACCLGNGACSLLTAEGCGLIPDAAYQGDGTTCLGDAALNGVDAACVTGACCLTDATCQRLTPRMCGAAPNAEYKGDNTVCRRDANGSGMVEACGLDGGTPCAFNDLAGCCDATADCNDNGVPDACEPRGDFNVNGRIDLDDFAILAECLSGPSIALRSTCCLCDLDGDSDADLADAAQMQRLIGTSP